MAKAPVVKKQRDETKAAYLSNKSLLEEVKACKATGVMSDKLARMLQLLCAKYGKKGNYVNYTYNDDMQAYAMMMLVRTWKGFDPDKGSNPFAFYTQCITNSFSQYLKQEKRQRDVRDAILVDQGMNPSFTYMENYKESNSVEDEQDFDNIKDTADQLNRVAMKPIERDDQGVELEVVLSDDDDDELSSVESTDVE